MHFPAKKNAFHFQKKIKRKWATESQSIKSATIEGVQRTRKLNFPFKKRLDSSFLLKMSFLKVFSNWAKESQCLQYKRTEQYYILY